MAKDEPFRPAPEVFAAPSPEASLCLHFIHEALLMGWRCIPEYPKSRFDILHIAEKWVSTQGATPGMQIGVQAKMGFTNPLMRQLEHPLRYQRMWNNPDFIVGLVPQVKPTAASKAKLVTLQMLGIGLFTAYDTFAGNDHPDTKRSVNLADLSKAGIRHNFAGRVPPPREDYPFTLPGSVGGQHWSAWKEKAIDFVVAMTIRGEPFILKDFYEHGIDPKVWIRKGWVTRTGERRGRSDLFKLNPESRDDRVDLQHQWEFERRLRKKRHEEEHEEDDEEEAAEDQERGGAVD